MLRTLRVRDLALIEELELVLEPGLNVITGETGAGKSILLQRVNGQDEHQAPRRVESHRELLDAVGGLRRTLEEMRARHGRLVAAREAIAAAHADAEASSERAEMLRAQAEELVRAALVPGEEEALAAERARLVHAERLAVLATGAEEGLYSGEGAVIEVLGRP